MLHSFILVSGFFREEGVSAIMALRIRLARGGSKKRPFYKLVVAENTAPRDGKFIERLGSYNPLLEKDNPERVVIEQERIKHWLSVGAQASDRVTRILADCGLITAPARRDTPKKSAPKKKAQERMKRERELAASAAAPEA
jgi:small subunit ribosomal protein S16